MKFLYFNTLKCMYVCIIPGVPIALILCVYVLVVLISA